LTAGEYPPSDASYACGTVGATGTTSGTAKSNLQNGVSYAVAVASEDNFGNVGQLSELACGTPAEVTGFFEAYREAGGEAGGGFCSFAVPRRPALVMAFGLALAGAALWRRRRW
jgi:hypothetical protein